MTPTWTIPLDAPPEVVAIGRNAHGLSDLGDRYRLPDLWSLHLYGYDAQLALDGQPVAIHPGALGVTPPGVLMETRYYGVSVHLYAHFRLPEGATQPVAALVDTGPAHAALHADLHEAAGAFARTPALARSRVWAALWRAVLLSDAPGAGAGAPHRAVRQAVEIIERTLDAPLSVAEIAHRVDLSPSHLTRLFQAAHGETVAEHVRRRRAERAADLLLRSTLPIKRIAASVGFPDLQGFNKAIRAHAGASPRELRARASR